jgi:hypothetical protein
MSNGTEIESIRSDGKCLCNSTEQEILHWIVDNAPPLSIDEALVIKRTPFGWEVAGTDPTNTENKAMDILMNAPVLFGLARQGHLPTIERMLAAGATWEEIGKEIGWCPETAKEHYEWHVEYKQAYERGLKR